MSTTTGTHEARAAEFAAAVRQHLSDLPREEVDELTDGLPADLADRLGDGGELGDPAGYAAELRQAAGLPPRTTSPDSSPAAVPLRDRVAAWGDRAQRWVTATPTRRAVSEFVVALRPVWWVLRGLVLAALIALFLNWGLAWWLAVTALAAIVVSVQWGRGKWAVSAWGRWVRRIASAVVIVALLPMSALVMERASQAFTQTSEEPWVQPGLTSDGEMITNIFAYDCAGDPLSEVRLYRPDGRPLHTGSGEPGGDFGWTPMSEGPGEMRRNAATAMPDEWNVFPLRQLHDLGWGDSEGMEEYQARPGSAAKLPFEKLAALADCDANADDPAATDRAAENDADATGSAASAAEAAKDPEAAEDPKDRAAEKAPSRP